MTRKPLRDLPRKLPFVRKTEKLVSARSVAGAVVTGALGLVVVAVRRVKRGR